MCTVEQDYLNRSRLQRFRICATSVVVNWRAMGMFTGRRQGWQSMLEHVIGAETICEGLPHGCTQHSMRSDMAK
jgi:hypothetical protein